MKIDNSKANVFRKCPDAFRERYIVGIEKQLNPDQIEGREFGHRVHELLEEHFLTQRGTPRVPYPPSEREETELEAQSMLAQYRGRYPNEPFVVVAVEQVFQIKLPRSEHVYTGKLDGVIRYKEAPYTGQLAILEHKTEKRGSRANAPESWAAKSQVSLYKFAVETLYQEPVAHILLDVLKRQSPKGQEQPLLYRDILERSTAQVDNAINDIIYVADQIERLSADYDTERWPQNTDSCCINSWKCDYFGLHVGQPDREFLVQVMGQYKRAEEYLPGL